MKESKALASFGALSQQTRLQIVRSLVRAGPEGTAAGEIAEELAVSPSNLSFHLRELEQAGIIPRAARRARSSMLPNTRR
jgi:ArsR family transcriptional regulator, arsenate/arsenite/antimonite-responsive transcriptional repressor